MLLHAAYRLAAVMALMLLPLTSPFSRAFLYVTAAFSLRLGGMWSLSLNRSSSAIACARFLSMLLWTRLLICHFLSRSICSFVSRGIFLP